MSCVPKQLTYESSIPEIPINLDHKIDFKQMQSIIDEHLPSDLRCDYLKMLSEVYVSKKRREYIIEVIREIINENG